MNHSYWDLFAPGGRFIGRAFAASASQAVYLAHHHTDWGSAVRSASPASAENENR